MKSRSFQLFILITAFASYAHGGSSSQITFTFEDHSLFPGNLQVLDENCKPSKTSICDNSMTIFSSFECQQNPSLNNCMQAHDEVLTVCPCKKADGKLRSPECQRTPAAPECKEARKILASPSCIPGLIYEAPAGNGVKRRISVCKSTGGFGNVSVRDSNRTSEWTNYPLVDDGDTIIFP